jgi:hypothetical protein
MTTNVSGYWKKNAIATPPDLSLLASAGYPTNGDPAKGIPATQPGAEWFYKVDAAINHIIQSAGLSIDPTQPEQLYAALQVFSRKTVPVGTIISFIGTTVPEGYLLCNGAAVSRTTYAALFAVIGTKCGVGDGSTTFNLPDTNGRFLEGTTDLSTVGTLVEAGLPNISGSGCGYQYALDIVNFGFCYLTGAFSSNYGNRKKHFALDSLVDNNDLGTLSWDFNASKSNAVYGTSSAVQPAALMTAKIVRYI